MRALRETAEWAMGHTGEQLVARLLQARGWYVLPSYDYSGEEGNKAPRLQGELKAYVIPDLDCAKGGKRIWVEVKTKTAATMTYAPSAIAGMSFEEARRQGAPGGTAEHGISERQVRNYEEVARETGAPVYIVVYETSTGDVLMAPLTELVETARESVMRKGAFSQGNMLYFRRDSMKLLGNVGSTA